MHFEEVQPEEFTRDVGEDCVLAVKLPAKQGSDAIRFLSKNLPLPPDLLHLKRVRKCDDYLQIIIGRFTEAPENVKSVLGIDAQCLEFVNVPKYPPLTREQLASAMKIWPVTYNKPSREPLDIDDATVKRYTHFLDEARACSTDGNGCVFVFNNHILARAGCSSAHPLHHCIMRGIEMIATLLRERQESLPDDLQYLCTDCEVYCVREPCIMCSMALVHSRVRLCVYDERHESFGGLGSRITLHTVKDLNHRYRVVRTRCKQVQQDP